MWLLLANQSALFQQCEAKVTLCKTFRFCKNLSAAGCFHSSLKSNLFLIVHSWPLFLYFVFSTVKSKCKFFVKFCQSLESNPGQLVLEATVLPTESQPLPKWWFFLEKNDFSNNAHDNCQQLLICTIWTFHF